MYDNIKSLRFSKDNMDLNIVTAMISSEGEVMKFKKSGKYYKGLSQESTYKWAIICFNIEVTAEGRVEDWMNEVLAEMRVTNRYITKQAIYDYGKVRERPR